MLRDYADYNNPSWDPSFRSERSGASSTNWRKNQGYNLSKPTPPELGGSYSSMGSIRDAETNPYYDPGWAQSVRRDNPSQNFASTSSYNGYNDPMNPENFGGSRSYHNPPTYPGMTTPRRTDKYYSNPTNPYYDPVWSQSYARNDEPIREGDHTMYYAPGYDRDSWGGQYGEQGGMMGDGYGDGMGMGGGGGGGYGGPMRGGGGMGRGGGGGGYGGYGRNDGPGRRMYAVPLSGQSKGAVLNGNSLMRAKRNTLFQSLDAPRSKISALKMAYFDGPGEWDGPPFEGPMGGGGMMPPPGYPGVTTGTGGPFGANQMNPGYYRRGGGSGTRRGGVQRPGSGMQRPGGMGGMGGQSMGMGRGGGMGQQGMGQQRMDGRGMMMGQQSMGGRGMMGQQSMGGRGMMGQRSMGMGRGMGMGGPPGMGIDPFVGGPESLRDSQAWSGPFGRDNAVGRMSLKDMAARSTRSFDAEVINSMNNRANARAGGGGGGMGGGGSFQGAGGERRGTTSSTTSTSSQYVPLSAPTPYVPMSAPTPGAVMDVNPGPLSATYGPRPGGDPVMDRSPPLNVGPPPPPPPLPVIDTNSMSMDLPQTIQAARIVRPSVVLVTSKGVRKENSQGSGFVVAFDDSGMDDDDDDDDYMFKDRVHILTSAHVAPPGWKVSVTFPNDPDKQYPATVVGRKLNSDLALLCVETVSDDVDEDYPFPPPLVMTAEDVSTDTFKSNDSSRVPTSEIGSPVYALGYPMGVEGPTMTSGILSATTKGINYMDAPTGEEPSEISKSRPFENTSFVITDAAMAGGMSGGPLVNSEGIVLGINALVRSDLRSLGNYAVSALECETFLEKLEDKRSRDGASRSRSTRRVSSRTVTENDDNADVEPSSPRGRGSIASDSQQSTEDDSGVAGYRVMLYGYSTDKPEATKILRRVAGLDELRAENAMRSANSFGAGVVDEFYVAESGNRERAVKAARKSADELEEKLKKEGMMVQVEPLNLLT